MKNNIPRIFALVILLMFRHQAASAGWIEKKEPVMKTVGWHFNAVYDDKFIFDTGSAPSDGKIKPGTYLYDGAADRVVFLTDEIFFGAKSFHSDQFVTLKDGNVLLFDIGKKVSRQLGSGSSAPDMDSRWVVYESGGEVVLYNLKSAKDKRIKPRERIISSSEFGPTISGDKVLWMERNGAGKGVIVSYSIRKDRIKDETELPAGALVNMEVFKARDDILIFSNKKEVYSYNIGTGVLKLISKPGTAQFLSAINNGLVFWDSDGGSAINIYDIAKDKLTVLQSKGASVYNVSAFKDKVFFLDYKRYELRRFDYKQE